MYTINNIGYLIFGNLEYQGYTENGIQFGSYSPTMGLMQNYVNLYHK